MIRLNRKAGMSRTYCKFKRLCKRNICQGYVRIILTSISC